MASFDSYTAITALYAEMGGSYYALRSAQISLNLGAGPVCVIDVICKIPTNRVSSARVGETLAVSSDITELVGVFNYGKKIAVKQKTTKGTTLLFDGFVFTSNTVMQSGAAHFRTAIQVDIRSAADLYNHEATIGGAYLSQESHVSAQFKSLAVAAHKQTTAVDEVWGKKMLLPTFNPSEFAASYIDGVSPVTKTAQGENFTTSGTTYDKLSNFIDIARAPTVDLCMPVGKTSNNLENPAVRHAGICADEIIAELQHMSGLSVFANFIQQFGLIIAPRVGKSFAFDVIPDLGLNSNAALSITPGQITSYLDQPGAKILGNYTAIAVQHNPLNAETAYHYTVWVAGYDDAGNPKVSKAITLDAGDGKDGGSRTTAHMQAHGPYVRVPLPRWFWVGVADKDADAKAKKYAAATAKTYYGRGKGVPGRLQVSVLFSELDKFYNRIGEVAKIDLSAVADGVGTKLPIKYGRLISVSYQIAADAAEFSASCSLAFDCVCTEAEHKAFGVSTADMLYSVTK